MRTLSNIAVAFSVIAVLAAPGWVLAQAAQPVLPFGGRVVSSVPCISAGGPSLWVTIVPFGLPGTIPFSFIWNALTLSTTIPPLPSIAPTHPGEQILGTYATLPPMPCFIGKIPVFGLQMFTENNSLPSGGF